LKGARDSVLLSPSEGRSLTRSWVWSFWRFGIGWQATRATA